jgi:hypothetical protein
MVAAPERTEGVDDNRRYIVRLQQEFGSIRLSLHLIDPLLHFARRSPKIDAENANAVSIDLPAQTVGIALNEVLYCAVISFSVNALL